jgi:hypothetical protein
MDCVSWHMKLLETRVMSWPGYFFRQIFADLGCRVLCPNLQDLLLISDTIAENVQRAMPRPQHDVSFV